MQDDQRSPTGTGPSCRLDPYSRMVLTGFMGAGKSTVGHLLPRKLGWAFLDLDKHIESSAGATAKDLFASRGESAFRKLESEALAFALGRSETITALRGAAIDATENQRLLASSKDTLVVFLDAPFAILIERCLVQQRSGRAPYRPLLHQTDVAHTRFSVRRSLFQDHAAFAVEVANRTAEGVAFLIWNTAGGRMS